MRTALDRAVINGGLQWSCWMKASVSFAPFDMSLPSLGERWLTLVDVQPNVCPSACLLCSSTKHSH